MMKNDKICIESLTPKTVLSDEQALQLASIDDTALLAKKACEYRDAHFGNSITYSKKVFFPLTQLCRDVCHYCTFAKTPKFIEKAYMPLEEVLEQAKKAAEIEIGRGRGRERG